MSYNEKYVSMRLKIKSLDDKNKNEAYLAYKNLFGEPCDIEKDSKNNVSFFDYYFEPSPENPIVPKIFDNKYYIDYVLYTANDYNPSEGISIKIEDINKAIKELLLIDNSFKKEDIKLISCSWYNGTDEPDLY